MQAENDEGRAREGPGPVGFGSPTGSTDSDITPVKGSAASIVPHGTDEVAAQLRRRREASTRLPALPCGHYDPIDCRR